MCTRMVVVIMRKHSAVLSVFTMAWCQRLAVFWTIVGPASSRIIGHPLATTRANIMHHKYILFTTIPF